MTLSQYIDKWFGVYCSLLCSIGMYSADFKFISGFMAALGIVNFIHEWTKP